MKYSTKYDSDTLMKNLWRCLARDFRSLEGPTYNSEVETFLGDMKKFRAHKWPARSQAPAHLFKQEVQLENLFKRYRFRDDVYTDKELEARTFQKFMDHQLEIARPRKDLRSSTFLVVQRARRLVKAILGKYSLEKHVDFCRFGTKANYGIAARNAYLDFKIGNATGSEEHTMWFLKHIVADNCDGVWDDLLLQKERSSKRLCVDSLVMMNVAKSWKIMRGIMPDTVIGGFYTNGLGDYVKDCLSTHGIRFGHLQAKHRKLARKYSKTRTYVTGDLTNASNSYIWQTMCRLMPRDWLRALDLGRSRNLTFNGETYANTSFMMMGIGYTSAIQTLLFNCLITAVKDLLNVKGFVSVYGDDLIYPRSIHRHVLGVFTDLGFTFNRDKTYVQDHFRESCGGDFFRGVDVRPFQPEGEYQVYNRKPYVLHLYKTLNGLLERWNEHDIPITVRFLLLEILRVDSFIVVVPPDFPEYSGLYAGTVHLDYTFWPIRVPYLDQSTWLWVYPRYEQQTNKRCVLNERAYLWDKLRTLRSRPQESIVFGPALVKPQPVKQKFVAAEVQPKNYRSKLSKKRLRLLVLTEAEKLSTGCIVLS